MKAEEKTVAFIMFFSVVMHFVYSLGGGKRNNKNKKKKQQNLGVGEGGGEGLEKRDRRAKF